MENVDLIKRSNRHTLTIKVNREGEVVVLAPFYYTDEKIEEFVKLKEDWIKKHKESVANANEKYSTKGVQENDSIYLFSEEFKVKFAKVKEVEIVDKNVILPVKYAKNTENHLKTWIKGIATEYLEERLFYLGNMLGFSGFTFKLTSARTKWGSCSKKGEIMLNFRLVECRKDVIDYVIMHELTHLKYFNHGKGFHSYLNKICPHVKEYKDWLNKNAGILNSY